jgi:DNA 3'-phosphatase
VTSVLGDEIGGWPTDLSPTPGEAFAEQGTDCFVLRDMHFSALGTGGVRVMVGFNGQDLQEVQCRVRDASAPLRVVAFDLDDTLVTKDSTVPCHPPSRLAEEWAKGDCLLVVFSNQGGVAKGKTSPEAVSDRLREVRRVLTAPLLFFASPEYDWARKPRLGMWALFLQFLAQCNPSLRLDRTRSVFVGDAAGRPPTTGGSRGDFSATDAGFALHAKLGFATPEGFFGGSKDSRDVKPSSWWTPLQHTPHHPCGLPTAPRAASSKAKSKPEHCTRLPPLGQRTPSTPSREPTSPLVWRIIHPAGKPPPLSASLGGPLVPSTGVQELVVLVGVAGSGKSSLCKHEFGCTWPVQGEHEELPRGGYVRVNQDTLRSFEKCVRVAKGILQHGLSVVIDATNLNPSKRASWLSVARQHGCQCRCVCLRWGFTVPVIMHHVALRQGLPPKSSLRAPEAAPRDAGLDGIDSWVVLRQAAELTWPTPATIVPPATVSGEAPPSDWLTPEGLSTGGQRSLAAMFGAPTKSTAPLCLGMPGGTLEEFDEIVEVGVCPGPFPSRIDLLEYYSPQDCALRVTGTS